MVTDAADDLRGQSLSFTGSEPRSESTVMKADFKQMFRIPACGQEFQHCMLRQSIS